jgi:hypothetical protein
MAVTPLAIGAADPDGDALIYSATLLPSGVTINTATGVISGTVGFNAAATNAVQVTVTDGNGGTATAAFNWTIADSAPPPVAGLVAAYGFDEGAGTTTADVSGNANTATISGAAWTTAGRFGGALSFDGVNDWVTVPDRSALDLTIGMTLEAWVNPSALSGWRAALMKEAPGGMSYALYAHDNVPRPAVTVSVGVDQSAAGTAALSLNTWSHLAATYDGTTLRLFVNGVQVGSNALTGNLTTSTGVLRIGGDAVWGEFYSGLIDEVKIYNRALSTSEIATDMGTPVGGPLVAAYAFDETAGSIASDASGHNLNGTVSGANWTAGRFGNGLQFDGTSDWVTVPHNNALNLTSGMTLEAWVLPSVLGDWRTVLLKEGTGGHTFALYAEGAGAPGAHLQANTDVISAGTVPLVAGIWTHLAATYDGTKLRLYVNGTLTATTPATGLPIVSAGPLRIGGNAIWGEFFAGVIDEVRIYSRALTAAEIQRDMVVPIR